MPEFFGANVEVNVDANVKVNVDANVKVNVDDRSELNGRSVDTGGAER
jgi:hypothetical protein